MAVVMKLPAIKQKSVEELIDMELLENERGIEAIVERFKNSVMVRALSVTGGNISQAAILLKTHRNNLTRWMNENGLKKRTAE